MKDENVLEFLGSEAEAVGLLDNELVDNRTGLYSYSVLLQFVEIEFYRFEAYHVPFSLILFEMSGKDHDTFAVEAITTASVRIGLVLGSRDVLGHGDDANQYGILVPGLRPTQCLMIASKVFQVLTACSLAAGLNKRSLDLSFGIAGLPDNGNSIVDLLAAARQARRRARGRGLPVFCFQGKPA